MGAAARRSPRHGITIAILAVVAISAVAPGAPPGARAQTTVVPGPGAAPPTTTATPAPLVDPAQPVEAPEELEPGEVDVTVDHAPPRALVVGGDVPPVPAVTPDRFAVMAFENRSGVRALDWMTAGVPFALGEKVEHQLRLEPAYDAWVVPAGAVVPATPDAVAAFAAARGARWVWTGWVERPEWKLRLAVSLWRVDGGAATSVGERVAVSPQFGDVHRLIGDAIVELGRRGGLGVGELQAEALRAPLTRDLYAFTLIGRGLAHHQGTVGAVNDAAARRDLERAVLIEPTVAAAQRLVGELWQLTATTPKQAARAAGKFAYAADLDRDYLPAVRATAVAAQAAGKQDVARELWDRIVRRRPWDLEARVRLGEALWATGDGDAAVRELERVVARAPDDLRARRMIALVHADHGDLARLVTQLEQIAARAPDDLDARVDLAAAYAALGRWDDARAAYEEVIAARPTDVTVLKLLGDVERRRGDAAAAAAWYARMGKAAPDDPRPPFLGALAYLAAGDIDQARRTLLPAQNLVDHKGDAYAALGALQYLAGAYDEALWYLKRAARLEPHRPGVRAALARALLRKAQGAAALEQLAAARALGGVGSELAYLEGVARAQLGDDAGARDALRAATEAGAPAAEVRRVLVAIERDEAPVPEGAPALNVRFGDVEVLVGAVDAFVAADAALAALRTEFDAVTLAMLATLGEGPGKDIKAARAGGWVRTCPIDRIAHPWAQARALEKRLWRAGLVLEEAYRTVELFDELGEAAGLTPAYRRRLINVRAAWRRARFGVREVRATLQVALGRELRARRCKDEILAAVAARPELYRGGGGSAVGPKAPGAVAPARQPPSATLYVDNRECTGPLEVWIDGVKIGVAPGRQRSAFEGRVGQHAICLLEPSDAAFCGDRGTVRQAYIHDGWSTTVHCRGATHTDVAPLPGGLPPAPPGTTAPAGEAPAAEAASPVETPAPAP